MNIIEKYLNLNNKSFHICELALLKEQKKKVTKNLFFEKTLFFSFVLGFLSLSLSLLFFSEYNMFVDNFNIFLMYKHDNILMFDTYLLFPFMVISSVFIYRTKEHQVLNVETFFGKRQIKRPELKILFLILCSIFMTYVVMLIPITIFLSIYIFFLIFMDNNQLKYLNKHIERLDQSNEIHKEFAIHKELDELKQKIFGDKENLVILYQMLQKETDKERLFALKNLRESFIKSKEVNENDLLLLYANKMNVLHND